jgi:hypothetical protein
LAVEQLEVAVERSAAAVRRLTAAVELLTAVERLTAEQPTSERPTAGLPGKSSASTLARPRTRSNSYHLTSIIHVLPGA